MEIWDIYIDSIFGYKGGYFYKTFIFFFFLGEFVTTHSIINAITDFHANQWGKRFTGYLADMKRGFKKKVEKYRHGYL